MGWRAAAFWRARPPSCLLLLRLLAAAAVLTAVAATAASGVFLSASGSPLLLARWCRRRLLGAPLACGSAKLLRPPGRSPGPARSAAAPPRPAPPLAGSHAPPPRDARAPPAAGDKSGLAGRRRAPYLRAGGFPAARGAGRGLVRAGGTPWGQPRPRVSRHTIDTLTH